MGMRNTKKSSASANNRIQNPARGSSDTSNAVAAGSGGAAIGGGGSAGAPGVKSGGAGAAGVIVSPSGVAGPRALLKKPVAEGEDSGCRGESVGGNTFC